MLQTIITNGVAFALLSLLFAGVLDVVYRRYSRVARSRGMYLMGMGVTFCALQLLNSWALNEPLTMSETTLAYGIAAGVFVTASNILLIESFTHLDVSLGSTIYRLNTIGVVALSWLFLAEALPIVKLVGIGFGISASLILYNSHPQAGATGHITAFFWIAVIASIFRAAFGVISKAGIVAGASASAMMTIAAVCWIAGGFAYAALRESNITVNRALIGYSMVSGTIVFLVINTLYAALARGDASVVIPIANLSFVMALLISVFTKMEHLSVRKIIALAFAVVAIVALSRGSPV